MNIIDAKRKEADVLGAETVYDGPPDGHKFSSQATFLTSQQRNTLSALTRVGRSYDNLYIRKNGSERWHLFSSRGKDGQPPVLFYFWYNNYGYKSFVYVSWNKIKTNEFLAMPAVERDQLLTTTLPIDISSIWKKDRAIDNIGFALESMPRQAVDGAIAAIAKKLKTNVSGMDINHVNISRIASLIGSLGNIGTSAAINLSAEIGDAFKKSTMVSLLKAMKGDEGAMPHWLIPRAIDTLRFNGINWPELDTISRSLKADGENRNIGESDDWITPIHNQVIRHAERELLHDVPDGNYWTISRVIQDLKASDVPTEMTVRLLNKYKQDIMDMQEKLLADEMVGVQAGLSNMVALLSVGIDWAELRRFIEDNKTSIMRTTLWDIAHSNEDMYQNDGMPILYGDLVKIGVNWPEMAVIKRSVDSSKQKIIGEDTIQVRNIKALLRDHPEVIAHMHNPPEDLVLYAVKQGYIDPSDLLRAVKNPSQNVLKAMLKYDPTSIEDIKNPSEELQLIAVKQDPHCISYIKKPTVAVQMVAFNMDPDSLSNVSKIDPGVVKAAVDAGKAHLIPHAVKIDDPQQQLASLKVRMDNLNNFTEIGPQVLRSIINSKRSVYLMDALMKATPDALDKNKDRIIKLILNHIKIPDYEDYPYQYPNRRRFLIDVVDLIKVLKPEWPEIDIIRKSLKAIKPKALGENDV